MQRVANCILRVNNQILMLKKPRRGWYVAPGGKMEAGESIKESVMREFKEETGLLVEEPELRGTFTFIIKEGESTIQEWMMFTFYGTAYSGDQLDVSEEGVLEWVPVEKVLDKPMAEGDRRIFEHILNSDEQIYGTFKYTSDFDLIDQDLDPSRPD